MRLSPGTCGALLTLAVCAAPAEAAPLSFGDFVTSAAINAVEGQNQTIGFAYAGNKFVGSVYFGSNNNQLYSTNLTGGGVAKFGAPITGFTGEIYVTASLGIGGFGPNRDVYTGSEAGGAVWRISTTARRRRSSPAAAAASSAACAASRSTRTACTATS